MHPLMAPVLDFMADQGLHQILRVDERILEGPFQGDAGIWRLVVWVPDRDRLVFFSASRLFVPPSRRPEVALLLAAINRGLLEAAFDLDLDSGEVRCRTTALSLGYEPNEPFWERALLANVVAFDRWLPAIEEVSLGGHTAAQALAAAEARRPRGDAGAS